MPMPMPWTKTAATRWERPLSGMEEYFVYIGNITADLSAGRQQYTLSSSVKVSLNLPIPESSLRGAWKQVHHEEPDIATTLEPGKKVYTVLNKPAEVEEWLDRTFIVDKERTADELYRLGRTMKPATMHYLPMSGELVLQAHHATFDGIGMIMFWDKFFKALVSPKNDITFGDEPSRLAPALDDLLGSGAEPTTEQQEKGAALFKEYVTKLPAIGFPSLIGKVPAGACQAMEHVLSKETTTSLIKACKEKGITVSSAVHAAYITVLQKYADPESATSRYTSPAEFNLRGRLPPPYNKSTAATYYSPLPFSVELPASFNRLAGVLNKYYRGYIDENPEILEIHGYFTRTLEQVVKTPEYQSAPIPTDALVSPLGIVENHLQRDYGDGKVVVKDWKLASDVILGMTSFHFYTFRDTLRFVYQFNEAYQRPGDIRFYMSEVEGVLRRELLV